MPTCADMRALGVFAASHFGTFTRSEAATNGVSRNDLTRLVRDGIVQRVRPAVYRFSAVEPTWRHELYAATLDVPAWASSASAAALLRVDGWLVPPERPEILCHHRAPVRSPIATVRRTTELTKKDVTIVDGIPCTNLARTIVDLAAVVEHDGLVRLVDHAQRVGASMTWLMQCAERLQARGRRGPREVLDVVRRRLGGYRVPDSWFERLLDECLSSPVLAGVVRQHVLLTAAGEFVARFDLALPWVRLGIEGHSRSFHLGETVERYDEDRDLRAAKEGWEVQYLGFAATRAPAAVRADIEQIVVRRAADLGIPLPRSNHAPRSNRAAPSSTDAPRCADAPRTAERWRPPRAV